MIRRPPRSTLDRSSAASDVYKRQSVPDRGKVNLLRAASALCVTLGALSAVAQPVDPVLRVCADPQNLPFSNQAGEGFENRIAQELARDLGKTTVEYTWFPQRMGFVRNTLRKKDDATGQYTCDVIIGVPAGYELTATTKPYMRSIYSLVHAERKDLEGLDTADNLVKLC